MTLKHCFILLGYFSLHLSLVAQDTLDVNLHVKHAVNGYSEFDRSRHIIFHDDLSGNEWDSDQQKIDLFERYDVYYGRNNGGIVWEYNNTKEDPNKAGWPDLDYMQTRGTSEINRHKNDVGVHQLENRYSNMMIGGQEHMYPHGQETTREGLVYSGYEATAEFYAQYLSKFFGDGGVTGKLKPRFLEVMNEPFVKSGQLGTTNANISRLHNDVAKRVKELNPEVMVGGYSAAHPAFESGGFSHWNNNWKTFIDIAGENMDFFSFHLYDNAAEGTDKMEDMDYRSGSNIQAIMDMINHYSVIKLGETKPWSISEYGFLCSGCENNSPYDPREDWYNLRSFNSMFLQILERQDQVVHSIPFFLLKANWAKPAGAAYNGYQARLMRELGELPGEPAHGGYIYTHLLKFYQFWAELKGVRVDSWTSDQDIQTDAYVDGNTVFVLVNSLEHADVELVLNLKGTAKNPLTKITMQQLYGDENDLPVLDTTYFTENLDKITVKNQATVLLKYEFENPLVIDQENSETSYFADKYLQPIKSGEKQTYTFIGVTVGNQGEAILRLGLGRDHGKSLKPSFTMNGTNVPVPDDWRGYDQLTRDSFFGVIEIPVPHELLMVNNTVELTFGDAGGHVSSLGLQVFNFSTAIDRSKKNETGFVLNNDLASKISMYPNPVSSILEIELGEHSKLPSKYMLHDISGKTVSIGNISSSRATIDMSALPAGIYWLKIQTGNEVDGQKIIKK